MLSKLLPGTPLAFFKKNSCFQIELHRVSLKSYLFQHQGQLQIDSYMDVTKIKIYHER